MATKARAKGAQLRVHDWSVRVRYAYGGKFAASYPKFITEFAGVAYIFALQSLKSNIV